MLPIDFLLSANLIVHLSTSILDIPKVQTQIVELQKAPLGSRIVLFLNSSGGELNLSRSIANAFIGKEVHCYVKYAASAAFQIILPACTRRFVTNNSVLHFHDTHMPLEVGQDFSERISMVATPLIQEENDRMVDAVSHMIRPDVGCGLLNAAPADVRLIMRKYTAGRSNTCLLGMLLFNNKFIATEFMRLTPLSTAFTYVPPQQWMYPTEQ